MPHCMLQIGGDGVGNSICLGITGEAYGKIFFLDHELHPYDPPDSWEGITQLADSFTQFLEILCELDEA
jgi:hypothetical protein